MSLVALLGHRKVNLVFHGYRETRQVAERFALEPQNSGMISKGGTISKIKDPVL